MHAVAFPPCIHPICVNAPVLAKIYLQAAVGHKQCIIEHIGLYPCIPRLFLRLRHYIHSGCNADFRRLYKCGFKQRPTVGHQIVDAIHSHYLHASFSQLREKTTIHISIRLASIKHLQLGEHPVFRLFVIWHSKTTKQIQCRFARWQFTIVHGKSVQATPIPSHGNYLRKNPSISNFRNVRSDAVSTPFRQAFIVIDSSLRRSRAINLDAHDFYIFAFCHFQQICQGSIKHRVACHRFVKQ